MLRNVPVAYTPFWQKCGFRCAREGDKSWLIAHLLLFFDWSVIGGWKVGCSRLGLCVVTFWVFDGLRGRRWEVGELLGLGYVFDALCRSLYCLARGLRCYWYFAMAYGLDGWQPLSLRMLFFTRGTGHPSSARHGNGNHEMQPFLACPTTMSMRTSRPMILVLSPAW